MEIEKKSGKYINYNVIGNSFVRLANDSEEGAIQDTTTGKMLKPLKGIKGEITGISVKTINAKKTGTSIDILSLYLKEGDKYMNVSMYLDSSEAKSLISRLVTFLYLDTCVNFIATLMVRYTVSGKYKNTRIDVYNERGEIVPFFYGKQNPLPSWNMVTINGKKVADKTSEINTLKDAVKDINELISSKTKLNSHNNEMDEVEDMLNTESYEASID